MSNSNKKDQKLAGNIAGISGKSSACEATQVAMLRQSMYQRIAQGYALTDVEDNARREWNKG